MEVSDAGAYVLNLLEQARRGGRFSQVMQIYRAEDGEVFQVNKTLRDIERFGTLERFLYDITGVEETAVLAYLSDGRRLRDDNLPELAGSKDQTIFVFNKHYLDYELEDILAKLRVDPSLESEVEGAHLDDVHVIASAAISHYDFTAHVFNTLHVQHEALRIASTSLDLNVLSISDAFEAFVGAGRRELEKQSVLLRGLELDLDVISKIRIHPEFLSPAARKAVEAGEKARTLGDYVSHVKMRQVGDACSKTHNELRARFNAAEDALTRLTSGADDVRSSILNSGLVAEAELCTKRSHEALERVTEIRTQLQEPRVDEAELLSELRKDDIVLRDEVQLIADLKNKSTALCMRALRHISQLNSDLVQLPQMLSSLQSDFRAKTSFVHIQRLHNMLYAYGATLVEIVRRKEFSRFFTQRAQTVAEIMAKLSSSERKRRQIYRGEVHGLLPFDTKGMEDSVPAMEITTSGVGTSIYTLERDDLITLLDEIDKIDQSRHFNEQNGSLDSNPLIETRSALEKLIMRMDNLETTFDKMAEKTIFSASRVALPRRQATDHTDGEFQELVEQLHELQDAKGDQERQFDEDRHILQTEIETLHLELRNVQDQASRNKEHLDRVENELYHQQTLRETEAGLRRDLEEHKTQLLANISHKQKSISDAESEATRQAKIVDSLRQELAKATLDYQEAKRLEMDASEQVMKLVMEKELQSQSMEEARAREEELSAELSAAREEVDQMKGELNQALEENDRRLRTQISDADRHLRDVIAEADGDRAVLEHQCFELKEMLDFMGRQLEESKAEIEILNADGSGLREELQRAEHDLQQLKRVEDALRHDLRSTQDTADEYKMRWEDSQQLVKDLVRVASAFRDSHCRAFAATQSPSSSKSVANLADSTTLIKSYVEPPEIDPEGLSDSLQILLGYDFSTFHEAVAKQGSTIRKWQKQCKEYRDRAKGKISFRNFTKGDLALFLPTRNSISKPWAAFNVSFPHYFLQAQGHLAEQLKTREWIVARITSITEQVASAKDPTSNPFGLADGTKFYMLKVEDWTQASSRRKSSPPKLETAEEPVDSPAYTQAQPDASETGGSTSFPAGAPETPQVILDASISPTAPFPISEVPGPASRVLLTTRQRTHSAPVPQASSLSRLLVQRTSPIEEVAERPSPSPPGSNSRPNSPLGRSASPLQRSSSLVRPSSPLARPSSTRTLSSSPLAERPHMLRTPSNSGPSSPLVHDSRPRSPHPRSRPHSVSHPSPPLHLADPHHGPSSPTLRPISPTHSHPQPPSPHIGGSSGSPRISASSPLAGQSPVQPSPRSAGSPLPHPGSRRSSSSSRPSSSSIFSAGRHPLALAAAQPKAAATTALTEPNVPLPSASREYLPVHIESLEHLPEESPLWREGSERRRAISGSGYGHGRAASSSFQEQSHGQARHAQGALASLASSWGFGKKKGESRAGKGDSRAARGDSRAIRRDSRDSRTATEISQTNSEGSSTAGNGTSISRSSAAASDILRRYDNILP